MLFYLTNPNLWLELYRDIGRKRDVLTEIILKNSESRARGDHLVLTESREDSEIEIMTYRAAGRSFEIRFERRLQNSAGRETRLPESAFSPNSASRGL